MRSLRRQLSALFALALLVLAFVVAAASANALAAGGGATVPSDGVAVDPDSRGPGITVQDAGNRPIADDYHGTVASSFDDIGDEGMTVTHDGMHVPLSEDLDDLKRGEL